MQNILLIPNTDRNSAEGSAIVAGLWWEREVDCWQRTDGDRTLEHARRLMRACKLTPKSGAAIPQVILDQGFEPPVLNCIKKLLDVGVWNPTILPFSQGGKEGFKLIRKTYARMFLMAYDPGASHPEAEIRVHPDAMPHPGEDPRIYNAVFSPFVMKRTDGPAGSPVEVAKALKEKMEAGRWTPKISSGTIGKAYWHRTPTMKFKPGVEAAGIQEGTMVNRELLVDPKLEAYSFEWLGYKNRPMQITDTEEVFPRIRVRWEDFPKAVREADPDFFDQNQKW